MSRKASDYMIYVQLIEGMAVIALAAYIYTRFQLSIKLIEENKFNYKISLIIFFSILAIIGTYLGVDVKPFAIANTRPIGVIAAGYIGGPFVGLAVGLIAGTHRYFLGGFTAEACAIATALEGIIGGLGNKFLKKSGLNNKEIFILGIAAQVMEMIIILLIAKPYEAAISLEKVIAVPMLLINTIGVVVFINIINNVRNEYARVSSIHAQKALNIARRTLKTIKLGLDESTAEKVTKIISETGEIDDVFIGGKNKLLAYTGDKAVTELIKEKLINFYEKPNPQKISLNINGKAYTFFCSPLITNEKEFEGVLGIKINSEKSTTDYYTRLCSELSELLSVQLEIYRLNKLANEANIAKLKALRAQIHPHFLFNALNTISYFCRVDAEKARTLIIDLSNFLRNTLKREEVFIEIEEEIKSISAYLAIEKARFGDRISVEIEIPKELRVCKIPTFILQPIVENCIKHGILKKDCGGKIIIKASSSGNDILFSVEDNGIGISQSKLAEIRNKSSGIGLENVNERLKLLYGKRYTLNIESELNNGTSISFYIPKIVASMD